MEVLTFRAKKKQINNLCVRLLSGRHHKFHDTVLTPLFPFHDPLLHPFYVPIDAFTMNATVTYVGTLSTTLLVFVFYQ